MTSYTICTPNGESFGACSVSDDLGLTWGEPEIVFSNESDFTSTLTQPHIFADPTIAVTGNVVRLYCQSTRKAVNTDLSLAFDWTRVSVDSGRVWSPIMPYQCHKHKYFAGMNHKAIRLADGSYLRGFSWDEQAEQDIPTFGEGDQYYRAALLRSIDGGETWTEGDSVSVTARCENSVPYAIHGACEPAFVQLADGVIYMLLRTGSDHLFETRSFNLGRSWEEPVPSPFVSHNCPAELLALGKGEVMAVFNNHPRLRTNTSVTISTDGCHSWSVPKPFAPIGFVSEQEAAYPVAELLPDGSIAVVWGQYRQANVQDRYKILCARFTREWVLL